MDDAFLTEQRRLEDLLLLIDRAIGAAEHSLADAGEARRRSGEEIWEGSRHVVRDMDDLVTVYTDSLVIDADNRSYALAEGELHSLQRTRTSPYFARIDFRDEQDGDVMEVYIGRRAFLGEDVLEIWVHDWRSPIASMFYDFDVGPAKYLTPDGTRTGEMLRKRQFRIEEGELLAMYDANALVRDEILGGILASSSGQRLKVIAETIQREQNAAIRFLAPRSMLIFGPAGSGKTSVGMHHIAFRLYHGRGRLSSADIAVVSSNQRFSDYIAGVLPDLYEADVQRLLFSDLLAQALPGGRGGDTAAGQADYLLSARRGDSRARWIQALYAPDFLGHLRDTIQHLPIDVFDIECEGSLIESAEAFRAHLDDGVTYPHSVMMQRIAHHATEKIEDWFVRSDERLRARIEARTARGELDIYTEHEMKHQLLKMKGRTIRNYQQKIRQRNALDPASVLLRVLECYPTDERLLRRFRARLARGGLFYEDLLALACTRACLGELEEAGGMRFVLLDEAQDYGPMQHFLLQTLFPRASFILLADERQALFPGVCTMTADALQALHPRAESFFLHRSYRSAAPIAALSASFLTGGGDIAWYDRPGEIPSLHVTDDVPGAVSEILRAPYEGTTAVIARTSAGAKRLFSLLGPDVEAALAQDGKEDASRPLIFPLFLTKGLEFDRVILADVEPRPDGLASEENMMYLSCSRALHNLHIVTGKSGAALLSGKEGLWEARN